MKSNGNIIISILFVLLISFLGLSLLNFSIFHTWIRGARTQKISETGRMHQELIFYLHHFREEIFGKNIRDFHQPEIDYFNNEYFPNIKSSNDNNIMINNSFTHRTIQKEYFKKIRVTDTIDLSSVKNNYGIKSGVFIDIVSGEIPLTFFPFFLNKTIDVPGDTFMKQNNVINRSTKNMVVDDMEVEWKSSEYISGSLDIKGKALSWAAIREKFGFEVCEEPIPDGIHLLKEDDVLKCIFIQGDVEQLIFSTQESIQNILVVKKSFPHGYHYKPGENYFVYWNKKNEELLFKEKIVVNGNILSMEQEGSAAFTGEANITLFCSGNITIRSSLETQNLNLKKIKSTNFTMACSSENLFTGEDLKPGITVDTQDDTVIQASIITDGKLTNKSPKLEVQGSIFCKDLQNEGVIEVTHLNSKSDSETFFRTTDFKYINRFYVTAIEEVIK